MRDLRARIGREELDYHALMAALSECANPGDGVTALLRRGDISQVKKGRLSPRTRPSGSGWSSAQQQG